MCGIMGIAQVRVPFLDVQVVDYAFGIAVGLKQHGPRRQEKWILRLVAQDLLPANIAWRRKSKFAVGSGLGGRLAEFAEGQISDGQFRRERRIAKGMSLRSKEELLYYRVFRQMYLQGELLRLVGRSRSV